MILCYVYQAVIKDTKEVDKNDLNENNHDGWGTYVKNYNELR